MSVKDEACFFLRKCKKFDMATRVEAQRSENIFLAERLQ